MQLLKAWVLTVLALIGLLIVLLSVVTVLLLLAGGLDHRNDNGNGHLH